MFENDAKILIIDDSEIYRSMISEILESEGYEVYSKPDGDSALADIDLIIPDLIILDVVMPKISGYEVCAKLKSNPKYHNTPVIFLTSLDSEIDEVHGFKLGAVDYVHKPISSSILKARVSTHLQLKKKTEDLQNKNYMLESLNEDLETFSYTLSHDLKNPLNINLMYAQLLLDNLQSLELNDMVEDVQVIIDNCNRMSNLIHDILQLTRINSQELHLTEINLSSLVSQVFNEIRVDSKDRACEFICLESQTVKADVNLLRIAIYNILHNAWKYSSSVNKPRIEFGLISESKGNIFFIKDNGVGFKADDTKNVFTAFKRFHTNDQFEGTGIGLATVKKVFDAHRSLVWLESVPDVGTTVYFSFNTSYSKD